MAIGTQFVNILLEIRQLLAVFQPVDIGTKI